MALTRRAAAASIIFLIACGAGSAAAQSVTTEADVSVGRSTEGVDAVASQVRLFGPIGSSGWRVFLEGAWGTVSPAGSDAFGAAYPYDDRARPTEVFTERLFRPPHTLLGLRTGRYRTPFGISGRGDYAYSGFTRAPLIRYDGRYGISNLFYELGGDLLVGAPSLQIETSVGMPADAGPDVRTRGTDAVVRVQTYFHAVILGASYLNATPSLAGPGITGRTSLGGMDGRWMAGGVELRGEWIAGRPIDEASTSGGYLDLSVHRPAMGIVTILGRIERLDYDAGPFSTYQRRQSAGAHVRISAALGIEAAVLHQTYALLDGRRTGLDVAVTYTIRVRP